MAEARLLHLLRAKYELGIREGVKFFLSLVELPFLKIVSIRPFFESDIDWDEFTHLSIVSNGDTIERESMRWVHTR